MPAPLLVPTTYGRPAAETLHARIAAAKADDPLRPVTVVVPTNAVGVSTRRLLASGALGQVTARGTGIAGLTLLTVYRLAELLGATRLAGTGRRPVSTPLVAAAVRAVLADEPGIFADVAAHPSTEEALVRSYRELSEVSEAHLDALARTSTRAAEVVRIRRAARARLRDDWFEEADLMAAASEGVHEGSTVLDDVGTVLVHLPQTLSRPAAALLTALAARTPVEVLAARTGAADADADVDQALRRLGLEPPATQDARPPVTAVVTVSDAEEEVRTAVERVLAAARAGVPLERVAVLYPAERPYARLVAEGLDAAGIAWNGRGVRPLADRLLGRWLLDLLALPEAGWSRPAVLGLLAAAAGTGHGRLPVAAWERASREAGVVRGAGTWSAQLDRLEREREALADAEAAGREGEEPREWLVRRHRASAGAARRLRAHVAELAGDLDRVSGPCAWADLAAWCRTMAARHLGDEDVRAAWPEEERRAAERVEEALDRLAGLDAVEPATTLATFRRALELELGEDLGKRGVLGRGVLVGGTAAALGVDLDVVVLLGLAEGVLPSRPREDSLLPDVEREATGGDLRQRTRHVGVEHRHVLAALAAARHERVLSFPRGDLRRSVVHEPSRWLLDAVADLRGDGERRLPGTAPWLTEVASFATRVRQTPQPATRQEYGLRVLAEAPGGPALRAHPLVAEDAALLRGTELAQTRGQAAFTRFDGNLSGRADDVASPIGAVLSASRLEAWLACPHAYLLQHVLRVEPVENPEELLEIEAMERGSLVHDVLERWLEGELARGVPAPEQPWSAAARARLLAIGAARCDDAEARGVTGHPLLWRRDRRTILADLERFLVADDTRRRRLGLTPVAAEQPFGLPGSGTDPVDIDLGDGRVVRIRGQVDRLDRMAGGGLLVTDYKSGGTSRYKGLGDEAPLGAKGIRLQLPIYGLAMRAVEPDADPLRVEYWFTSTRGKFEAHGCRLTPAVEDALRRALAVAVGGIEAGHFPMRPPEPGWAPWTECRFCDPDDLGTADRYRDWERVRTAPELSSYVGYVEPEPAAAGP